MLASLCKINTGTASGVYMTPGGREKLEIGYEKTTGRVFFCYVHDDSNIV